MSYLDPKSTAATTEAVTAELSKKLPAGISMLTPSPAEDKDVVAVTQATADKYKLKTISDLKPVAGELVLGGPPEWKTRTQGVVGLRDVYGLNFKDFVSLDAGGTLTMTALTNGQIQAGDLFSTDPGLSRNNLVALEDDKSLFAAENVVPLIKSGQAERHRHQDAGRGVGEAHHRRPDLDERRGRHGHQPVRHRQEVARRRRHIEGLTTAICGAAPALSAAAAPQIVYKNGRRGTMSVDDDERQASQSARQAGRVARRACGATARAGPV